jgi:predicted nucleic acid-binding protein
MIVADANLLAYLWIPGPFSSTAVNCLQRDADWMVPTLWRSELRSILVQYLRKKLMDLPTAIRIIREAEKMLQGSEHRVPSEEILDLALQSSSSAYDCEYVVLARQLGVKLVTNDARILKNFPDDAIAVNAFLKP